MSLPQSRLRSTASRLLPRSAPPAREATLWQSSFPNFPPISIHASREGGDGRRSRRSHRYTHFNPRLPRGRRLSPYKGFYLSRDISIHASREGGDMGALRQHIRHSVFQSTPPAREATHFYHNPQAQKQFQSTPPAREATPPLFRQFFTVQNFNPRLPRGRRLWNNRTHTNSMNISIHASREGGDKDPHTHLLLHIYFNPRLPQGRRLSNACPAV